MKKRKVTIKDGRLLIDGKARFLLSGEIHYFRIDPKDWPARLAQAKKAGLTAVSTYVPWRWHEIRPGVHDFRGDSDPRRGGRRPSRAAGAMEGAFRRRDLEGYIAAVKRSGLDLILRLGPVSNGEMRFEGLPDRIALDAKAVNRPKEALHHSVAPRYLAKAFLGQATRWLKDLLPIVVRNQSTRGGPVILVQLDNEIGMVHWVSGLPLDPKYFAGYFERLQRQARRAGIVVPLIANIPQFYDYDVRGRGVFAPLTSQMFERFDKSGCQIMGGAYQPRRLDAENGHDIHLATEVVRSVQKNGIAICAETQTGLLFDRPRLYPKDVSLLLQLAAASDLRGLNLYMFAGGTNPDDLGEFGPRHDWQAPISPEGRPRPHLAAIRRFSVELKRLERFLADGEIVTDVDLAVPRLYYRDPKGAAINECHAFLFDGVARLLHLRGHIPRWVWIGGDRISGRDAKRTGRSLEHETVFLFSLEAMDAAAQREIVTAARRGSRVVMGPDMPVRDERGRPCTILADALGITRTVIKSAQKTSHRCTILGETILPLRRPITVDAPGAEILGESGGKALAGTVRLGKGSVTFIGLPLTDRQDVQKEAFGAVLDRLGVVPRIRFRSASPDRPVAQVRRRGGEELILAANLHETDWRGEMIAGPARRRLAIPGRTAQWFRRKGERLWPA